MGSTNLTPNHLHTLLLILRYVDGLLFDAERIVSDVDHDSPFPEYVADFPMERQEILKEGISDFRETVRLIMENLSISPDPPSVSSYRYVSTSLAFAEMSLEKIEPKHMVAYGKLTPAAERELLDIAESLQMKIRRMKGKVDKRPTSME